MGGSSTTPIRMSQRSRIRGAFHEDPPLISLKPRSVTGGTAAPAHRTIAGAAALRAARGRLGADNTPRPDTRQAQLRRFPAASRSATLIAPRGVVRPAVGWTDRSVPAPSVREFPEPCSGADRNTMHAPSRLPRPCGPTLVLVLALVLVRRAPQRNTPRGRAGRVPAAGGAGRPRRRGPRHARPAPARGGQGPASHGPGKRPTRPPRSGRSRRCSTRTA